MTTPEETTERRALLRRLDDVLEALEQLNLSEATQLPDRVRRSLEAHQLPYEDGAEVRILIERVWRKQEAHMLSPRQERRRNPSRRSGSRRHPGQEVIESILRQVQRGEGPQV